MTANGRLVLGLGILTYLVARAFGSRPLYPVALGLLLALCLAWLWVRLARGPMRLRRTIGVGDHLEGDDVPVEVELRHSARVAPASTVLVERIAKLGERSTPLRKAARGQRGGYVLGGLRRGRYAFGEARAVIEDAFGLQRVELPLSAPAALLVYPRLAELTRLFSEGGAYGRDGRRVLVRRQSGFDLHSVREYEQGESLRKVHWRSTAKRGQLMVKELEDSPRDEVAVLLDARGAVDPAVGEDVFDVQVRAAGSILLAQARRGRRALLVVNGASVVSQRVHSLAGDWRAALDVLAAAEPDGRSPAAALLADEASAASRALELTVVTASVSPQLVERLLQRTTTQRRAALVYVDAASFAGRPRTRAAALPRLVSAGVAVAVVGRG